MQVNCVRCFVLLTTVFTLLSACGGGGSHAARGLHSVDAYSGATPEQLALVEETGAYSALFDHIDNGVRLEPPFRRGTTRVEGENLTEPGTIEIDQDGIKGRYRIEELSRTATSMRQRGSIELAYDFEQSPDEFLSTYDPLDVLVKAFGSMTGKMHLTQRFDATIEVNPNAQVIEFKDVFAAIKRADVSMSQALVGTITLESGETIELDTSITIAIGTNDFKSLDGLGCKGVEEMVLRSTSSGGIVVWRGVEISYAALLRASFDEAGLSAEECDDFNPFASQMGSRTPMTSEEAIRELLRRVSLR